MGQKGKSYTWRDYSPSDNAWVIRITQQEMQNHVLAQGIEWPNFLSQMFLPHLQDHPIIRILKSKNRLIGYYWLFDLQTTERLFGQKQTVFLNSVIVDRKEQGKGWGAIMLAKMPCTGP